MRVGILTSTALAIAIGVVVATGGGGGGSLANLWVDTNGGTCTRSASLVAYVDASACSSLNVAYSASGVACGDTILVKGGTYSSPQQVNEVAGLSGCGSNVVIAAASGETVTFDRLVLGDPYEGGSPATNVPDHLTLRGFVLPQGFSIYGDGNDDVIDQMNGGAFVIGAANNILVSNGDWGPCTSTPAQCRSADPVSPQIVIENGASNITLQGNSIHDFTLTGALDHFECMRMDHDQTNLIIRGNHFWGCELYASTSTGEGGTTIIENNWFGCTGEGLSGPCDRGSSIVNIGDTSGTYILRFNSFAAGEGIADEGSPTGGQANRFIVGNILGAANCTDMTDRATVNYNAFFSTGGATCGTNATYLGATGPYVNTSSTSAGNYHLSGAAGSTGADNYVPTSAANSGAATDYDAQNRPIDANRDAGSDER